MPGQRDANSQRRRHEEGTQIASELRADGAERVDVDYVYALTFSIDVGLLSRLSAPGDERR